MGVKVGTYWFHSDDPSRIQQIALLMLGQSMPSGIMWKTMSGEFVEMTPTLASQIFSALLVKEQTTFAIAESHKVAMNSSEDPQNYDFSGNWPQTYLDTL